MGLRRINTRAARCLLMLSVVAVVGCGAQSTSSPSSGGASTPTPTATPSPTPVTAIDACQLVTQADAQVIAGTPLNPGQAGNPDNPSCTYNFPVSGPEAQVSVFAGAGAKKTLDIDRTLGHTLTPVSVGDEAYEEANAIFVRKSSMWVAIELVRLNDDASQNRAPLEQLATKVAAELAALGL
jgi:hypothetical protein